ncbi:MAG: methyltransferase [Nitrospira sp.]|nr:methyltransferase [Nitrospira sp.]
MGEEQKAEGSWGSGPDFMFVMKIASAYWSSRVLHAANRLDVFTKLDGHNTKDATAEELAVQCNADKRGLDILLVACTALGLLNRKDGRYSNTAVSDYFLVKGRERYQGGIVSMFDDWYTPWLGLTESVVTGKPAIQKPHDISEEATRNYIMGMHDRGVGQAYLLSDTVDLKGKKQMLDIAGGPGQFTIFMCKKTPGMKGIIFDLPQTLRITREIIKRYSAEDQVTTMEGDYLKDNFGAGHDVVLLSSMMNQESPEVNKQTFKKAFNSMVSSGTLILQEQMLNADKTGPELSALIGVNQLIHTPAGAAYSEKEITDWLEEAGFRGIEFKKLSQPSPFTVLTAIKP